MGRLTRLAPLSGLAFVVLFGIGSGIWAFDQPRRGAAISELVAFYTDTSTRILIGGSLSLISLVFLVWFGSMLRERLLAGGGNETDGLPLVAFGGALLAAAVGVGAETINMAGDLRADDGQLTSGAAQIY
ncbi:MAG: hypothetical protein QOK35_3701, partial [Pseudonocardiales bacterium]|nr:hypothetical protein [Pseudonocardiales bacterium]